MMLTSEQIDALVSALPGCTSGHRRELLPRVLEEWGRTDLEEHLERATPERVRTERRQMKRLARCASKLALALSDLEPDCRFAIASRLLGDETHGTADRRGYDERRQADRRLSEEPARLGRLASAATEVADGWVPLPLRHGTIVRYLILQDLAAIFEWATGGRAGRRVRSDAYDEAGQEYGPFRDFARATWPMIFGSEKGLDHAIKTWAKGRAQHGERSPFMLNLHLRHPEWRIPKR
jgi:hypothetical protein